MNNTDSGELLRDILRDVSRSFYLTLRVLPTAVRSQIGLAYLLARTTDTIADTELVPLQERLGALRRLRERITGTSSAALDLASFTAKAPSSAEKALLQRCEESLSLLDRMGVEDRRDIISVLQTITSGQEQDLTHFQGASAQDIRSLNSPSELDHYTYLVAGCVGEFWTRICRRKLFPRAALQEEQLLAEGVRFGKGLQLVNILRDLPADLRAGRCYIPAGQLASRGLNPSNLLDPKEFARFKPIYEEWLNVCQSHLIEGWKYTNSLPYTQVRVRLACAWPLLIGFETLGLLRSCNPLDPTRRIKLSRARVKNLITKSILLYPAPVAWKRLVP